MKKKTISECMSLVVVIVIMQYVGNRAGHGSEVRG